MRSKRSSPNPLDGVAGALDFLSRSCSPLLCFRALSRRVLALVDFSSRLESSSRFGLASDRDVAFSVAFGISLRRPVLVPSKGVSLKRWQARQLVRIYFSDTAESRPSLYFFDPGFEAAFFDDPLSNIFVCDVQPGIKMVPHAIQDDLDASLHLSLALRATSICRSSMSCAEVAGAVAEYRCAEASRNLIFASAAASAILRVLCRNASPVLGIL